VRDYDVEENMVDGHVKTRPTLAQGLAIIGVSGLIENQFTELGTVHEEDEDDDFALALDEVGVGQEAISDGQANSKTFRESRDANNQAIARWVSGGLCCF
jgi:hypothetical protein